MKLTYDFDEQMKILQHPGRPNTAVLLNMLFPDFMELHGDRLYGDDSAVMGGIATFEGRAVTVIGQMKGRDVDENIRYNFSMCHPEGFRKLLRLVKQAEKFERPVICFVDTPGAFPGEEAEGRGQSAAIANCLMELMDVKVPIISIVIGSACSGGALAFMIANEIAMLEYAAFSVISPKGAAEILWKDSSRQEEAAKMLKITSGELWEMSLIDEVLPEPEQGAHMDVEVMIQDIRAYICRILKKYQNKSGRYIAKQRQQKYRNIG